MEAIKYYVKGAFVGVAETPEVLEQQEELIADMTAKVADLVADGRSEDEALGMAIASMGDLSGLVKEFATEEPAVGEPSAAPAAPAVPEPVLVDVEIAKLRLHTVFMSAGGAVAVLFVLTMLGALVGLDQRWRGCDGPTAHSGARWGGSPSSCSASTRTPKRSPRSTRRKRSMRTPILQWVAVVRCGVRDEPGRSGPRASGRGRCGSVPQHGPRPSTCGACSSSAASSCIPRSRRSRRPTPPARSPTVSSRPRG